MAQLNREHQKALEKIMGEMRGLFGSHFRLTLLARNASSTAPDKDILISEDQLDSVEKAVQRIKFEQLLSTTGVRTN